MAGVIRTALLPVEPLQFEHVISKTSSPDNYGEEVYDIEVDVVWQMPLTFYCT